MHKIFYYYFFLALLFIGGIAQETNAQFLHRDHKKIIGIYGNEVNLKGISLGGFMIQEGYIMESAACANTQHEYRAKVVGSIGESGATEFYNKWLTNQCTKADIDSLAKWGFNSIRLPLHYNLFTLPIEKEPISGENTWLTQGFTLVDNILSWCEADNIYLILDLHGAPGGQGHEASISDYDSSKPSLWESSLNQAKTVALWQKIAEHYSGKSFIGGYDLINEPNWDLSSGTVLKKMYTDIIAAIRSVDKEHMLFVEGNWFANDFTGLLPIAVGGALMDENMAYSFHKYWNSTDVSSIQWMLDIRNNYDVPLWMGESGENSNEWFTETIKMLETNNIGWSWWPVKKIGSVVGPCTIKETANYKTLLSYWTKGSYPATDFAYNTLMEIADNAKIQNCIQHPDVIDAMFRQVKQTTTKQFKNLVIPGTINFSDYDMGSLNEAYWDADYLNNGTMTTWNQGYTYRNDGVDIEACSDTENSNGWDVGWSNKNEWLTYTANVSIKGVYDITFRVATTSNTGLFHIEVNGTDVSGSIKVTSTGGWQIWKSVIVQNIPMEAGVNVIKYHVDQNEFNISSMTWNGPTSVTNIPFRMLSARTTIDGTQVIVAYNKDLLSSATFLSADFILSKGTVITLGDAIINPSNTKELILNIPDGLFFSDNLTLTYNGSSVVSSVSDVSPAFTNEPVTNNMPVKLLIPGQIEAENYNAMSGVSIESCSDISGGSDVGYTDSNDYMEYNVYVSESGLYNVDIRYSTPDPSAQAKFALEDGTEQLFPVFPLPSTGDFGTWKTLGTSLNLTKGAHTLRLIVVTSRFNTNYFVFTKEVTGISQVSANIQFILYPNPASEVLYIQQPGTSSFNVEITDINGKLCISERMSNTTNNNLVINKLAKGIYMVKITSNNSIENHKLIVE